MRSAVSRLRQLFMLLLVLLLAYLIGRGCSTQP